MGHDSSDGSKLADRLKKWGSVEGWYGENISYGKDNALDVILALMIDDNVPSRGHRTNIMNPNFKVCGVFTGQHKTWQTAAVMDFAGSYTLGSLRPQDGVRASLPKT
jgi:uncharacterized protein YkwD